MMNQELEKGELISLEIDNQRGKGILSLKGIVNIQHAPELKSSLLKGLKEVRYLEIKTELLQELDAATVQVLLSARLYAQTQDRSLVFQSALPAPVITGMKKLGLSEEQITSLTS